MAAALAEYGVWLSESWFFARAGLSSAEMIALFAAEQGGPDALPMAEIVAKRDACFLGQLRVGG